MSDIFISYRHEGEPELVKRLKDKLIDDGYKTFLDDEMRGCDITEEIFKRIEECQDFVVILDKDFFVNTLSGTDYENDWTRRELSHAIKQNKRVIPVMLPGFQWPDQLPEDIKKVKDQNGVPYSPEYFKGFYKRFQEHLKTKRPFKTYLGPIGWGLLVLSLLGIALYFASQKQKEISQKLKEPTLVLMGGGSVKNYIRDTFHFDLSEYIPKSYKYIYVPTPTQLAWPQIAEVRSIKNTDINNYPYHLVLLSAGQATAQELIPDSIERNSFRDHSGYIEEVLLGKNKLKVAVYDKSNHLEQYVNEGDSIIFVQKLVDLLSCPDVAVYTTKRGSGTYHLYDSIFKSRDFDLNNLNNIEEYRESQYLSFAENTELAVVLGSSTYLNDIKGTKPYYVCDEGLKSIISNNLYLYFIIFKQDKHYMIPNVVRGFLGDIGIEMPDNENLEDDLGSLIHRQITQKTKQ